MGVGGWGLPNVLMIMVRAKVGEAATFRFWHLVELLSYPCPSGLTYDTMLVEYLPRYSGRGGKLRN